MRHHLSPWRPEHVAAVAGAAHKSGKRLTDGMARALIIADASYRRALGRPHGGSASALQDRGLLVGTRNGLSATVMGGQAYRTTAEGRAIIRRALRATAPTT